MPWIDEGFPVPASFQVPVQQFDIPGLDRRQLRRATVQPWQPQRFAALRIQQNQASWIFYPFIGASMENNWLTWGKHDGQRFHPLKDHCIDVASVFSALLEIRSISPQDCLTPTQKQRLSVLAFLHDFGKCNRGFQAKACPAAREIAGHVMEAAALLLEFQPLWPPDWLDLITTISGWFCSDEQALQMLLASISHHGRPISLSDYHCSGVDRIAKKWWSPADTYDPLEGLEELAQAARCAWPDAFRHDVPAIDATPELQHRFAGLVMLADWIGSDTRFFPYRQNDKEDRLELARHAARRALRAIGLEPPEPRKVKPFESIFYFQPTPLQQTLAHTLEINDSARLLLAESDTGSGKTEAALAWFFRLYAQHKVDGLYFALPTRVAARELYERIRQAIDAAFEPALRPGPVLLAAPGYVKVDGASAQPLLADPQGTLWEDNVQDQRRERLWSAERPKRFLAAPVAVGTMDQALLSVLQVKHSLLRSVCLDRHLLVVDEVHASDPYMREVLRALLRGHLARGGWALLLSATLGEVAASLYFERDLLPLQAAQAQPYPLLSSRSGNWPMPAARKRRIQVEISPTLTDDQALLSALLDSLQSGARVLVVCNTVARANALFRRMEAALQKEYPHLLSALFSLDAVRCPHHGRFAREDRERLDAAVTVQLGKGSPNGPRLVIGTQTLEQSLDIDADWLVTDLAPMDVLIQRIGRLHRHEQRKRPSAFRTPRVTVRVPTQEMSSYLSKDGDLRAPAGLGSIYADGRALTCTWNLLQDNPTLELPRQARHLIECTTHPEAWEALPEIWRGHGRHLAGKVQAEIAQALRSVLDHKPFGELHYVDKSERVLTRLGRPTFELPLAEPMVSPFGLPIHRVAIPSHWLREDQLPETVRASPCAEGFRFSIGQTFLRYTRFGLEKDEANHA